jgi:hypothetical protein
MSARRMIGAGVGLIARGLHAARVPLLAVAIAALFAAFTHAGTNRFELQAPITTGTSGNSAGVSVRDARELLVMVSCTASSGTGETLDMYLQTSLDGGTTWVDVPADVAEETSATVTEGTTTANKRDFFELAADDLCSTYLGATGKYVVFGDYVRVKWIIAGTTPSYTFKVVVVAKT